MARPARREPTNRELDERVTRLEHQVAEIATTVTQTNEVAVREIAEFKRAFVEHREEVRRALAETATRELLIREVSGLRAELRGELQSLRTEFGGELQNLRTELGGELQNLRTELGGELQSLRTELGDELQSLRAELGGKTRGLQVGLDELRVVGDGRQMLADQRHAEIMGQFEKLFSGLREN
jgi:chromosome segregation ATPase